MYLHKSKRKDGRTYLSLVAAYREGGKKRMRTVESLGYLDELEKSYADPIAHFRSVCEERNAEERAAAQPVTVKIHPMQRIDGVRSPGRTSARRCFWPSTASWASRPPSATPPGARSPPTTPTR